MKVMKPLLVSLGLVLCSSASAVPITVNYTSDNVTLDGGVCLVVSCDPLNDPSDFGFIFTDPAAPNVADWRDADTAVFDLAPGTYGIAFVARNFPNPGPGNPGGFLAEILWSGGSNVTTSAWDVTVNGTDWVSATEWAQNGTGIWGGNLLGEISDQAYWLWSANNFTANTDQTAGFRTTITIRSVPEPGTLALLGLGLFGLGMARRRS